MQSKRVFVDDNWMRYYALGDKNKLPLLLIHSFHNNAQTSLPIAKALAKKFHVVVPDLPGFGASVPFQKTRYSIESATTLLELFITKLKMTHCLLMGISMGGAIATRMAMTTPERFKGLILLHPLHSGAHITFRHKSTIIKLLRISQLPFTATLLNLLWSNTTVVRFVLKKLYGNVTQEYLSWRLQLLNTCTPRTYLEALSSILSYAPLHRTVTTLPTLLIYNPKDNLINPHKTRVGYQSMFPQMKTIKSSFDTHNPTPRQLLRYLEKSTFVLDTIQKIYSHPSLQ